jgi:hypothetical protein
MSEIEVRLTFKREVSNYVVATDPTGTERWFDRRKVRLKVEGPEVVAWVDDTNWRKRMAAPLAEVIETKPRSCLCCKRRFGAERNQYVCSDCKNTEAWREGRHSFDCW